MHLLSCSARGLASNPVVMVTPWVVGVGTGLGLGWGGGVMHVHTHTHTRIKVRGPVLEKPVPVPWSALSFSFLCFPPTFNSMSPLFWGDTHQDYCLLSPITHPPTYTHTYRHTIRVFMYLCCSISPLQTAIIPLCPPAWFPPLYSRWFHTGIKVFHTHVKWYEH